MASLSTHPAALPEDELWAQVRISRHKAGGPGGQRRNKVETAVRLEHRPTGLVAEANERRAAEDNRRMALRRLRRLLALRHREPLGEQARAALAAGAWRPSELWVARTGGPRLSVSASHADVPALLAEALDLLAACDDDLGVAAGHLGVAPSRLVKVLRLEPAALSELNRRLVDAGRRPWR